MLLIAEKAFIGNRRLEKRYLQAADQRLDFSGQRLIIKNEIKQHRHQIDDRIVGLIQCMHGFLARLLTE